MAEKKMRRPSPPRANPATTKSSGAAVKKSRPQAETAAAVTNKNNSDPDGVPLTSAGKPMVKIMMTASELVPTGQFANIMVGPAQITMYVDPDDPNGISDAHKENLAASMNDLAEVVEADVVAAQRDIVLETMQSQIAGDASEK